MNLVKPLLALLAAGLAASAAHADGFVTVRPGDALALDLSGAGITLGATGAATATAGPFTVSNAGSGVLFGDATAVSLGDNGAWLAAAPWADRPAGAPIGAFVNGNLAADNAVTFALAPGQRTSFVGLRYMVDTSGSPAGDLQLLVYDQAGSIIGGSAVLSPIAAAQQNDGAFIGYVSDAAEIGSFRVLGAYHVYGDVSFAQPVPEPGEIASMLAGLVAAGTLARRRRASAAAR